MNAWTGEWRDGWVEVSTWTFQLTLLYNLQKGDPLQSLLSVKHLLRECANFMRDRDFTKSPLYWIFLSLLGRSHFRFYLSSYSVHV